MQTVIEVDPVNDSGKSLRGAFGRLCCHRFEDTFLRTTLIGRIKYSPDEIKDDILIRKISSHNLEVALLRNKSFTWLYPHMAMRLERDGHVTILDLFYNMAIFPFSLVARLVVI